MDITSTQRVFGGLEPLLGIEELAGYLKVPVATIYDWRVDGKGPRAIRVRKHVQFMVADVRVWLEAR
ncbi:MAG: helix-turn-helix domain-containing protein [Micrococcales bacterium]|nr:helix-turn-helix domain-containing protein [Micrococcales bacterium]